MEKFQTIITVGSTHTRLNNKKVFVIVVDVLAVCGPQGCISSLKTEVWNDANTPSHVPKHIELLMKYWLSVLTQLAFWLNCSCSLSHALPLWVLRSNRCHVCSAGNRGCSLRSWWKWSSISGFWRRVAGVSWTAWSHLPWIWWTTVSQNQDWLLMLNSAELESRPWPHHYHELL